MHVDNCQVVLDNRPVEGDFRLGQTALGLQQDVQRFGADFVSRLNRLDLLLGRDAAVEVGPRYHDTKIQIANRGGQLVRYLQLLLAQQRFLADKVQLCEANAGQLLAETDGNREFHSQLPALEVAAGHVLEGVVESVQGHSAFTIGADQVVAHAQPLI